MMYPWQSFGAHQQPKDFTDKILHSSDFRESFAAKREGQHAHARRGIGCHFVGFVVFDTSQFP